MPVPIATPTDISTRRTADKETLRADARRLLRYVWDGDPATLPALRFDFIGRHGTAPKVRSVFEVAAAERRRLDRSRQLGVRRTTTPELLDTRRNLP